MSRLRAGLVAGLSFGIVDVIPMIFMDLPDRSTAMIAAFINRFATGFIIPNLSVSLPGWIKGAAVALLLSIPDALITAAYGPILGFGVVGGIIIGAIVERKNKVTG